MKKLLIAGLIALGIFGAANIGGAQAYTSSSSYPVPSAYLCRGGYYVPAIGFSVTYMFTLTGPGGAGICTRTVSY